MALCISSKSRHRRIDFPPKDSSFNFPHMASQGTLAGVNPQVYRYLLFILHFQLSPQKHVQTAGCSFLCRIKPLPHWKLPCFPLSSKKQVSYYLKFHAFVAPRAGSALLATEQVAMLSETGSAMGPLYAYLKTSEPNEQAFQQSPTLVNRSFRAKEKMGSGIEHMRSY